MSEESTINYNKQACHAQACAIQSEYSYIHEWCHKWKVIWKNGLKKAVWKYTKEIKCFFQKNQKKKRGIYKKTNDSHTNYTTQYKKVNSLIPVWIYDIIVHLIVYYSLFETNQLQRVKVHSCHWCALRLLPSILWFKWKRCQNCLLSLSRVTVAKNQAATRRSVCGR